jgi:transcriptional regulator EpsA
VQKITGEMSLFSTLSTQQLESFLDVIQDSLAIRCHQDVLLWLQDEVQYFLPHDILIAAWGDFCLGLVHLDAISYLPGLRTTEIENQDLLPSLMKMFEQWMESGRTPLEIKLDDAALHLSAREDENSFGKAVVNMRCALVHGIKDQRGRHDCLYVAFSSKPHFEVTAIRSIELLLPHIDSALRQVAHLPTQYPNPQEPECLDSDDDSSQDANLHGLTAREFEIMRWVCLGKTNLEIGSILNISSFTVKNHLQSVFRKLNVTNRAQAVIKLGMAGIGTNG